MAHRLSNSISSDNGDDQIPAHPNRQPLTSSGSQASLVNRSRNVTKDAINLELPSYRYIQDTCYQKPKGILEIFSSCLSGHHHRPISCWISIAATFTLIVTALTALAHTRQIKRHVQNSFKNIYYGLDPLMLGRDDTQFPAPYCMYEPQQQQTPLEKKVAVVTYLRDDNYLPLFQQLSCTLRASNPHIDLALMYVPGDLGSAAMHELEKKLNNITLLAVPPVTEYTNYYEPRYARNWLKLRAWSLVQYDMVLLVDADVAIVGDISPLFSLPTPFAAAPDQSRWLNRFKTHLEKFNGGVLLLRPCPAIEQHMMQILEAYPKLRFTFGTAEQEFLTWYFRYVAMTLPLEYNAQASQSLIGNVTVGGMRPRIIHFTEHTKPWKGPVPGVPGHQYLCPRTIQDKGWKQGGDGRKEKAERANTPEGENA